MFDESILLRKAGKKSVEEVYREPLEKQISLFRDTLQDLEEHLDTADLARIKLKAVQVIKNDLLNIIKGFRGLQQSQPAEVFTYVESVDKILDSLRPAKNVVLEMEGMFHGQNLKDEKRDVFFNKKIEECRAHIKKSLKAFR